MEALVSVTGEGRELVVVLDDAYFGLFYDEDVSRGVALRAPGGSGASTFSASSSTGRPRRSTPGACASGSSPSASWRADARRRSTPPSRRRSGGAIRGNVSQLPAALAVGAAGRDGRPRISPAQKEEKYRLMKERALKVKEVLADPRYGRRGSRTRSTPGTSCACGSRAWTPRSSG